MQSRSYLFLGVVVLLAGLSGWLFQTKKFNYGLDVEGGVRFIYQLEAPKDMKISMAEAQARVIAVLENRATGPLGVAEPIIQPKGEDQIIVELPGAVTVEQAREVIGSTARLEWYHAKNVTTPQATFRPYRAQEAGSDKPEVWFTSSASPERVIKPKLEDGKPNPEYLGIIKGWTRILEGEDLANAIAEPAIGGDGYRPGFMFTQEGARKMEAWCRANFGREENLAAVLDGTVLSLAHLQKNAIISDQGVIDGSFSSQYVLSLTSLLKSGALPVSLTELSSSSVDPTQGEFALKQIVQTGAISFGIIALFLIVYYIFPGFIALIALGLYVLFTLTALKLANATFSLAAIAGFVLSVGMAVDANILVFERVKEELREGRSLQKAIELGFKRAFSAILDSNACTIITSLVLSALGTGPVRGFASTLIIGVAISLFTAVVVTRSLLMFITGSGLATNPKLYGTGRSWFGEKFEAEANEKPLKILEKSKTWFLISFATIVPGIIFIGLGGLKPNVEFQGGYAASYVAPAGSTDKTIIETLEKAGLKDASVKFSTGMVQKLGADGKPELLNGKPVTEEKRLANITIPFGDVIKEKVPDGEKVAAAQKAKDSVASALGVKSTELSNDSFVGGTIREETIRNAIMGVVLSTAGIVFYLALRFGFALGGFVMGLRFAMSVILALIHDVVIVIGLAAITGFFLNWDISALFISAMLTVIGFSTHDTIVIFDRIRENLRKPLPDEDMKNLINRSITQSVARSINTSATVIATLLLLIVFGSASTELRQFNLAMLAGIVSGTYSSIFNAAPILYFWDKAVASKKGEAGSLIAIARKSAGRVRLNRDNVGEVVAESDAPAAPSGYGQTKRRTRASEYGQRMDD